jgi:cyclic pyranopterin phosphate synthase
LPSPAGVRFSNFHFRFSNFRFLRASSMPKKLSHYDRAGRIRMVDVSPKPDTLRRATASVLVKMSRGALRAAKRNPKGDPLEIARIAGIAAAKRTADLIPLCHPLMLSHIDVRADFCKNGVAISSTVCSTGPTGVEMEALTAVAVAALTVYDMCKALDRGIEITELRLLEKSGGKSGTYRAPRRRARRGAGKFGER